MKQQKVYKYHLSFLEKQTDLNDWLLINGYIISHSHRDFQMKMVYTFWTNSVSDDTDPTVCSNENCLLIVYNEEQDSISIFEHAKSVTMEDKLHLLPDFSELTSDHLANDIDNEIDFMSDEGTYR